MKRTALFIVTLTLVVSPMCAQSSGSDCRGCFVEEVRNDKPAFVVRVDVDRKDRVYKNGDVVKVYVTSEKEGYLYLFYRMANGQVTCLYPNKHQKNNRIPAGKKIVVPAADADFVLRIGPPFGKELLKAVVTLDYIPPEKFGVPTLTRQDVTPMPDKYLKAIYVDELEKKPVRWAEHAIHIHTVDEKGQPPAPLRVAVVVGLDTFADPTIRQLIVSDEDARQMAQVLKQLCGFDEVILLVNEQATLAEIENAIRGRAAEITRPGDTVFIYWSGHCGRISDVNGDEKDGYDEYLVPYGGSLASARKIRDTMLMDDTFGRWIQDLDGRRVVLVLDACHSGGQATFEKGLGLPDPVPTGAFDFLVAGELGRAKDVGQENCVMLCSAKAAQKAFERREGDLSVMTYFLINHLKNGSGKVTLRDAFKYIEIEVPKYVEENFPGAEQTPVLIPDDGNIVLRP